MDEILCYLNNKKSSIACDLTKTFELVDHKMCKFLNIVLRVDL